MKSTCTCTWIHKSDSSLPFSPSLPPSLSLPPFLSLSFCSSLLTLHWGHGRSDDCETSSVNRENSKSVHTPAVEGSSERIVRHFSYHPLELKREKHQPHTHARTHAHTHTHTHTLTHSLIMNTLLESPSLSFSLTFNRIWVVTIHASDRFHDICAFANWENKIGKEGEKERGKERKKISLTSSDQLSLPSVQVTSQRWQW